jgi:uncharacterized membrane protein YeaQ/YmgE (transglycosylase-associated protein family)
MLCTMVVETWVYVPIVGFFARQILGIVGSRIETIFFSLVGVLTTLEDVVYKSKKLGNFNFY